MQVLGASVSSSLKLSWMECASLGVTQQPLDFSPAECWWVKDDPLGVGWMQAGQVVTSLLAAPPGVAGMSCKWGQR